MKLTNNKDNPVIWMILSLLVILSIWPVCAEAYTPVTRTFGIREGFSAHIYNIVQDPAGVLWMAQDGGGLIAFDGNHIKRFDTRSGLPSNSVNRVMLSRDNIIWVSLFDGPPIWKAYNDLGGWHKTEANGFIGSYDIIETLNDEILIATSNGVFMLDGHTWKPWPPSQNPAVTDTDFTHIFQSDSGTVFALSGVGRVWKLYPNQPLLLFDESSRAKVSMSVYETLNRRILVSGHSDGLMELNLDGGLKKAEPESSQLPKGVIVNRILSTKNERLVLGTWGNGVYIFNNGKLEQVINQKYGLPYEYIESLFEDREGNLYITAMMGGLYQIINLSQSKFKNITAADGLMGDIVWQISRTYKGALRVLSHGNLITDFYRDGTINSMDLKTVGVEGTMLGIYRETEELTWFFGIGGAFLIDESFKVLDKITPDNFPARNIRAMHKDEQGNLYFFTSTKGLVIRDKKNKLTILDEKKGMVNAITGMEIDKDGNFVMSSSQGIVIFNPESGKAEIIDSFEGMSLNRLSDVAIDTIGRMWFASPRGVYMLYENKVRHFSTADGLPNDNIYLVVADKLASVWVGTSDGVARINNNNSIMSFGYNDGMLNPETNSAAGFLDEDGTVWFGTPNGVTGINSSNIPLNLNPPEIIINGVEVGDKNCELFKEFVSGGQSYGIKLPYDKNSLAISYTSPHMSWPDSLYFLTRISGVSENWSKPSYIRQINFAHPSPGTYQFEVKACNSDKICSVKPASISITILPPFYMTFWFRALFVFVVILTTIVIYKLRLDIHVKREKELERLVEDRTHEIREMSLRDPLTNLRNRRYIFETMPHHLPKQIAVLQEKRSQSRKPMGFFMVDIDHFKKINDKYGHDSGDLVLKRFARLLEANFRPQDIVCRWGGEEFLVITSHMSLENMKALAERIRLNISIADFKVTAARIIKLTCSIGFTTLPFYPEATPLNMKWEDAVSISDMGLYRAKENGRNQWVAVLPGERIPHSYEKKIFLSNLDWSLSHGFMKLELD